MSRIKKRFSELRSRGQKALVAFITAGDPDLESTKQIFKTIEDNGADIIEIGVPFTDPLADGPVILQSALRSIKKGTSLKKILQLVRDIREESELPIVLMSSYNPIFVYGDKAFVRDAVSAGIDGLIIPDLPPDEEDSIPDYSRANGLDMIYLLAPTSTNSRIQLVAQKSSGFVYYVSLTGVTGTRENLAKGIRDKVSRIKESIKQPVLIGFGISGPEQASEAAQFSDGVIVGSAIVGMINEIKDPVRRDSQVGTFVKELKDSIKS